MCCCWSSGFARRNCKISQGAAFREAALRPIRREKPLPAPRGRILARDGTVLACDRIVKAVAVDYRWLEEPPRQTWLEQLARKRLPKEQRRNAARLAAEVAKLRQEREELHKRLAALCGIELAQWQARARKVQEHVERIAADVRRRQIEAARTVPPPPSSADVVRSAFGGAARNIRAGTRCRARRRHRGRGTIRSRLGRRCSRPLPWPKSNRTANDIPARGSCS